MTADQKNKQAQGKAGQAGKYEANGFQPKGKQIRKPITLLDILLGRR